MKRLLGLLATLVTTHHLAAADPAAEKLFRDGRDLIRAGKIAEACDAFERSDQLEPRVGTLLNLADCRERQGRTATAWTLFLEAKARAVNARDQRTGVALERATKLEPRLSYLTLKVTPTDGLAIKRAGVDIAPTAWNVAVPVDPAEYTIEASAPHHQAWSVTRALKAGDRVTITIGPLVAAAVVEAAPPAVAAVEPPSESEDATTVPAATAAAAAAAAPSPRARHFAVGAALGVAAGKVSSAPNSNPDVLADDHMPIGLRLLGNFAVPYGAVRTVGSVLYTKGLNDKTDSTNTKKLYVMGLAADYVYMPRPQLAFAAGLGLGWDYEVRSYDQGTDLSRWTSLRASPLIVRLLDGAVELGIHTQLIRRGDDFGFIGVAAIDVFVL